MRDVRSVGRRGCQSEAKEADADSSGEEELETREDASSEVAADCPGEVVTEDAEAVDSRRAISQWQVAMRMTKTRKRATPPCQDGSGPRRSLA